MLNFLNVSNVSLLKLPNLNMHILHTHTIMYIGVRSGNKNQNIFRACAKKVSTFKYICRSLFFL